MTITQNTRERLVIKDFPWAFGLFFILGSCPFLYIGLKGLIQGTGIDKIASGVFVFVSVFMLLAGAVFTKRSVFVFDLTQQQLSWSQFGLFGGKSGTISFGRITGCVVQTMQMSRQAPTYRIALASPDGDIPLTDTYSSGSISDRQKLREAIHTALGLPAPEPESTPDINKQVQALIFNGQIMDAIKLVRQSRGCSIAEAKDLVDSQKGDRLG